jgi:hypothetical protein
MRIIAGKIRVFGIPQTPASVAEMGFETASGFQVNVLACALFEIA